ncbi:C6 transcription factor [Penicillium atrosanguineum]|nr:C6 transcription factor [Penicillium atrosanguineum]
MCSKHLELPGYVKKLGHRLAREDQEFLEAKKAFTIPEPAVFRRILMAYTDHVHNYLPVLDLGSFLLAICSDKPRPCISMFVLQAVMFAAASHLNDDTLSLSGYKNRYQARKTFYQRAKLLYNFDVEDDDICLLQGSLLLTLWHGAPDDHTTSWHWVSLSVTCALKIGLHQETSWEMQQRSFRRRIWWSLYVRERLTALWIQQAPQLKDNEFNVNDLQPEDFEGPITHPDIIAYLGESSLLSRPDAQRDLELIFIDMSRLCIIIGRILSMKFLFPPKSGNVLLQALPANIEVRSQRQAATLDGHEAGLLQWLDDHTRRSLLERGYQTEISKSQDIVFVSVLMTRMLYFTAMVILHTARAARPIELGGDPMPAFMKARSAAAGVTSLMAELCNRNLIGYLPITGVTVIIPAIAVHMQEMQSLDPQTRIEGYINLQLGNQCFNELSDMYVSAGWPTLFFEALTIGSIARLPFLAFPPNSPHAPHQNSDHSASDNRRDLAVHLTSNLKNCAPTLDPLLPGLGLSDSVDPSQLCLNAPFL